MACQSNLAFLLKGMNVRDAAPFYDLRGRIFSVPPSDVQMSVEAARSGRNDWGARCVCYRQSRSLWGTLWSSLWKISCAPTERLPWQCSPYSSCFVSLLSGILETWPAHLTKAFSRRVCTLGCWPFLGPPCQEFFPAIWCGGICWESSDDNDWAAWRVCYRQFKRRGEWWLPLHGKPSEILTESLEGDAGLSYPVVEFSIKVHLSWRCTTQIGEVRINCL